MDKRQRTPKYAAFGALIQSWRGDRDISAVVRRVKALGIDLSEPTLRSWEYGWIGRPDPVRLLAVASIYGVSALNVLDALLFGLKLPPINLPADSGRVVPTEDELEMQELWRSASEDIRQFALGLLRYGAKRSATPESGNRPGSGPQRVERKIHGTRRAARRR